MGDNRKRKSGIAVVMSLCILLLVLFAECYLASNLEHDCTGTGCPICAELHVAEAILAQISGAVGENTVVLILSGMTVYLLLRMEVRAFRNTPIDEKVRMDN